MFFSHLIPAAKVPPFGLNRWHVARIGSAPNKLDLGVGVYSVMNKASRASFTNPLKEQKSALFLLKHTRK